MRTAKLELVIAMAGEMAITRRAATDTAAAAAGITVEPDTWVPDDSVQRKDMYLRAEDRDALHRYVEDLAVRDPSLALSPGFRLGYQRLAPDDGGAPSWRTYLLDSARQLDGTTITGAELVYDPTANRPEVMITFSPAGAGALARLTRDNAGSKMAIVLDGEVRSAPIINGPIAGGRSVVSMGGTDRGAQEREATELVAVLRSGSLPRPMEHLATLPFERGTGGGFFARSWMFFALAAALAAALAFLLVRGRRTR